MSHTAIQDEDVPINPALLAFDKATAAGVKLSDIDAEKLQTQKAFVKGIQDDVPNAADATNDVDDALDAEAVGLAVDEGLAETAQTDNPLEACQPAKDFINPQSQIDVVSIWSTRLKGYNPTGNTQEQRSHLQVQVWQFCLSLSLSPPKRGSC